MSQLFEIGDKVYQHDSAGHIYESTVLEVIENLVPGLYYYVTNVIDFDERAVGNSVFKSAEEAKEHYKKATR